MRIISETTVNTKELVDALKQGASFVYPTETCYGLGADATSDDAVKKLFEIKERPQNKPMLVVFSSVETAKQYVEWDSVLDAISAKYWPGPLTVVVSVKENAPFSHFLVGTDRTIAFRISSHPLVQRITTELGGPVVSTSANIAGGENPYSVEAVLKSFAEKGMQPDFVIDAGTLPYSSPSTIVKIKDKKFEVLRQGDIQVDIL